MDQALTQKNAENLKEIYKKIKELINQNKPIEENFSNNEDFLKTQQSFEKTMEIFTEIENNFKNFNKTLEDVIQVKDEKELFEDNFKKGVDDSFTESVKAIGTAYQKYCDNILGYYHDEILKKIQEMAVQISCDTYSHPKYEAEIFDNFEYNWETLKDNSMAEYLDKAIEIRAADLKKREIILWLKLDRSLGTQIVPECKNRLDQFLEDNASNEDLEYVKKIVIELEKDMLLL